jgi:hypothetical protein
VAAFKLKDSDRPLLCAIAHKADDDSQIQISNSLRHPTVIASASEAIHGATQVAWIASSLSLACANALRLSQAMT